MVLGTSSLCTSPSSFENKDFSIQWHFVAYNPAVDTSVTYSRLRPTPWLLAGQETTLREAAFPLSALQARSLQMFKGEQRARSRRDCSPHPPTAGTDPASLCPSSMQADGHKGGHLISADQSETGGRSRGRTWTQPKPPPNPCCTVSAAHHFIYAPKEEQKI